jgi:clathrin heavy chain
MITKNGYAYVFDIETGIQIYFVRISNVTVFITAEHTAVGGIIGINRPGMVCALSCFECSFKAHF